MATTPTFTRRAINALVAQARGGFAVYAYKSSQGRRYMLHDRSGAGRWSHIPHLGYSQCFDVPDKEAAAAPYCTDLMTVRPLVIDLLNRWTPNRLLHTAGLTGIEGQKVQSDERALRFVLLWLREMHGVRIERHQVINDLPGD